MLPYGNIGKKHVKLQIFQKTKGKLLSKYNNEAS